MLKLDFINVGDGDAILIRASRHGGKDYIVLVDCGRPHIEFVKGSKRRHVINYLMKEKVGHIDLMLISHLHFDHMGGALAVLRHIPVGRLVALYFPPEGAGWITTPAYDEKAIVGMCDALNMFRDIVNCACEKGTVCEKAACGKDALTDSLTMSVYLPGAELIGRQRQVFDSLYLGGSPVHDELYAVSKERNCSSLIARLDYAGKSVLLPGDSYAAYWENSGQRRCDILKLPHHGDEKSMTEKLIRSLAPDYAVISCQNDTSTKKERPAASVIDMLKKYVPTVLCTENRELPSFPASAHEAVRFTISDSGTISRRPDGQ